MHYLWAFIFIVIESVGFAAGVVGLPGNWLMLLAAAVLAWWQPNGVELFGRTPLLVALGLAVTGELVELFAGAAGARRAGGSRAAAVASLVGAVVGGIVGTMVLPIPVVGSVVGVCAGAFVLAMTAELAGGRGIGESWRSARGAAWGRFWGTMGKLMAGVVIWVVLAGAALTS